MPYRYLGASGYRWMHLTLEPEAIAMMYTLGTIRKFQTPNFKVVVDAVEEDDLDLSFDESGDGA